MELKDLAKYNVTRAVMRNGWVSVWLDGRLLPRQKVDFRKHLRFVADWHRKKPKIFIDDSMAAIDRRWVKFVAVHEIVEKYFSQKYGFTAEAAHKPTTIIEHKYIRRLHGETEVRRYEAFVKFLYDWELNQNHKRGRA